MLRLIALRSGRNLGQVRPCVVTADHGDGTLDVTVFVTKDDGLSHTGLLQLRVRADYLGDEGKGPDSALANARASLLKEQQDAAAAADAAAKAAKAARDRIAKAEADAAAARDRAQQMETSAESTAEKAAKLASDVDRAKAEAVIAEQQAKLAAAKAAEPPPAIPPPDGGEDEAGKPKKKK